MKKTGAAMSREEAIRFDASTVETKLIFQIAKRAVVIAARSASGVVLDTLDVAMDLTATHLNGTHLDLDGLQHASESKLIHDVLGIRDHLDRHPVRLDGSFLPLAARPQAARHTASQL